MLNCLPDKDLFSNSSGINHGIGLFRSLWFHLLSDADGSGELQMTAISCKTLHGTQCDVHAFVLWCFGRHGAQKRQVSVTGDKLNLWKARSKVSKNKQCPNKISKHSGTFSNVRSQTLSVSETELNNKTQTCTNNDVLYTTMQKSVPLFPEII